jgi:hypothetical protein
MTLVKAPAGHWAGGTAAATCFSAAANAALAVTVSLSPQTLEWREEGKDAAGKAVFGAAGEITIYGREREGVSSSGKEAPAAVSGVLTISSPSSPSKKYDLAELRALAGSGSLSLSRLIAAPEMSVSAVVVVTSRNGALSAFSFAEISSSSSSPSLDVSGAAPRLVAGSGRGLEDVVSVELRVLSPAK